MATLVLRTAGTLIGTMIGGPLGGMIGGAVGAVAGYAVDQTLFGQSKSPLPKHATLDQLTSNEGAEIPRIYGRVRVGGELIWATKFEEQLTVTKQSKKGAKGGGGSAQKVKTYRYFANVAIGLCEGPIAGIRRVWADNKELDLTTVTMRLYRGDEHQTPDPLIIAKEFPHPVPAYRGLAYIVFERFPLSDFGNRMPQIGVEIIRPLNDIHHKARAVCLIPGAGEFAYDTIAIMRQSAPGVSVSENRHVLTHPTDFLASLDNLQTVCPRVQHISLVVSWFGDDLRAGRASLAPRIDNASKTTLPDIWRCAGLMRADARLVSFDQGRPIYGGTPSDQSVIRAIHEMRARGMKVMLNPFVMMDIAAANTLVNPYTGQVPQPPLPWRGRITGERAPGRAGSVDGTAQVRDEISRFFGRSQPADFITGDHQVQSVAPDWRYRHFILHYAYLAKLAGGVDSFLIGSEFVGLTRLRDETGQFPAVQAFMQLARDVKSILGSHCKIGYGADWTEYGGYWIAPGELRFPLDPLWALPEIDFVGIDCYWPITDWRGPDDEDAQEARSPYDPDYLTCRVADGEAYAWYYADDNARLQGRRTPIEDGLGMAWINRPKDVKGWWSHQHFERRGGALSSVTPWVPASKPIWFTEIGCPAVDCGSNAPNLFPDPRSSENGRPPFSRGLRDDLMPLRMLEASLNFWEDPNHNPISPIYGAPMVDVNRLYIWAWDARPYPAFPSLSSIWGDAENWTSGHWLNGRFESVAVDRLAQDILAMAGLRAPRPAIDQTIDGITIGESTSPREVLEALCDLFGYDLVASAGQIRFVAGDEKPVMTLGQDDLVPDRDGRLLGIVRSQDSDLPRAVKLTYRDSDNAYQSASVFSRRIEGQTQRQVSLRTNLYLWRGLAQSAAERWLERRWTFRETATTRFRPGLIALEVGDVVEIDLGQGPRLWQITRLNDQIERSVELRSVKRAVEKNAGAVSYLNPQIAPPIAGPPALIVFSPPAVLADPPPLLLAAAFAKPWPGGFAIRRERDSIDEEVVTSIEAPATMGRVENEIRPGPLWRFDRQQAIEVTLSGGTLISVGEGGALAGNALAAIGSEDRGWEIIAYAQAELIGERRYRLSGLLRGLGGSEDMAQKTMAAGAHFIALDGAIVSLTDDPQDLGTPALWRIGEDQTQVEVKAEARRAALKPLAPVHPRIRRQSDGVLISFIRRTRKGGDGWDSVEIPLNEEGEFYRLSLLDRDGATKREWLLREPFVLYQAQDELTDFGTRQTRLHLKIVQISAIAGEGFPCLADCLIA